MSTPRRTLAGPIVLGVIAAVLAFLLLMLSGCGTDTTRADYVRAQWNQTSVEDRVAVCEGYILLGRDALVRQSIAEGVNPEDIHELMRILEVECADVVY